MCPLSTIFHSHHPRCRRRCSCKDVRTRVNIKLYKMRALRKVWEEKVGGGEAKEGEEKNEAAAEVAA